MSTSGEAASGIVLLVWFVIAITMGVGWVMNFYKFTQLDFEAPYKAEIIRAVGVVPIVGAFTGWMTIGEENIKVEKKAE
jgi:hypothetical protein